MLDQLKQIVGEFPERVSLDAVVLESVDEGAYTRHKVEYSVENDERIRAYLLIPHDLKRSHPALFCHHQHAGNYELGKSEVVGLAGDANQAFAKELAERGYITFAPDAVGFEERMIEADPPLASYFRLASRLVIGQTLTAKVLGDVIAGIDFLVSRTEVDSERIGFIGHSYGGRMAIWAPVYDRRIKVSVSSCGCSEYSHGIATESGIQMEFCLPGILNWGDMRDIVTLTDPASVMILAGRGDKWSNGAQEIVDVARSAHVQGELALYVHEHGHTFPPEARRVAYDFLDKHLGPNKSESG